MPSKNLASIFQPGILSHPAHDMAPEQYKLSQEVVEFLIDYQTYFLFQNQIEVANNEKSSDNNNNANNNDNGGDEIPSRDIGNDGGDLSSGFVVKIDRNNNVNSPLKSSLSIRRSSFESPVSRYESTDEGDVGKTNDPEEGQSNVDGKSSIKDSSLNRSGSNKLVRSRTLPSKKSKYGRNEKNEKNETNEANEKNETSETNETSEKSETNETSESEKNETSERTEKYETSESIEKNEKIGGNEAISNGNLNFHP